MKRLLIFALAVASCLTPLKSATLGRLTLDEMVIKSTSIVRGKVTASWAAFTGTVIYTHYRIQVIESFKGTGQNAVEIVVPGGAVNSVHQNFSGAPVLNRGDEFVFFLWTSHSGVTWITGLTQGLFALPADSGGERVATRMASRELMLDAATSQAVKDRALSMRLSDLRTRIAATLAAPASATPTAATPTAQGGAR